MFDLELKASVFSECKRQLEERQINIEQQLNLLKESLVGETKSSAGDKYETGRAMLHMEMDKLKQQLWQVASQKQALGHYQVGLEAERVQTAVLVKTSMGLFFILTSLGKLVVKGQKVYVISLVAPIGVKMKDLEVGDKFEQNGKLVEILDLC